MNFLRFINQFIHPLYSCLQANAHTQCDQQPIVKGSI